MHVQEMYRRLTGLVVFRRLLQDPVVAACGEMLSARVRGDSGDFSAACAGFTPASRSGPRGRNPAQPAPSR